MSVKMVFILFLLAVPATFAESWVKVVTDEAGAVKSLGYEDSVKEHIFGFNEYMTSYIFPTNAFIYWKKVGSDWVAMTPVEQAVVDQKNFNLKKTIYWTNLVNDIEMYPALLDNFTNSIQQVSNAATKNALQDAKVLIKELQNEIKDLKVVIGKLQQYE